MLFMGFNINLMWRNPTNTMATCIKVFIRANVRTEAKLFDFHSFFITARKTNSFVFTQTLTILVVC